MDESFADHRAAARSLLAIETLAEREGQFCGGIAYRTAPISDKRSNWLRILLDRHGLPALANGGSQ